MYQMRTTYTPHDEIARAQLMARAHRAAAISAGARAFGRGVRRAWRGVAAALHRPHAA